MNCNIIHDLFPSYIDGICSEETARVVEEHVGKCKECQRVLKRMQQPQEVTAVPEEMKKAKKPFQLIKRKKRIQVFGAIIITFFLTAVGYQIVQEVEVVHNLFFPQIYVVNATNDSADWERLTFDDSEFLEFDNIFFKKSITNHANSESDVVLRIKDVNGNVLIDHLSISPGTSTDLEELKRKEKYIVEMKPQTLGAVFLTIS